MKVGGRNPSGGGQAEIVSRRARPLLVTVSGEFTLKVGCGRSRRRGGDEKGLQGHMPLLGVGTAEVDGMGLEIDLSKSDTVPLAVAA